MGLVESSEPRGLQAVVECGVESVTQNASQPGVARGQAGPSNPARHVSTRHVFTQVDPLHPLARRRCAPRRWNP